MASVIDEDIVVKFKEGSISFANPGEQVWIQLTKNDDKGITPEDKKKMFLGLITGVTDLQHKDGTQVTPESLQGGRYAEIFYITIYREFFNACTKLINPEGDSAKNG